MERGEIWWAATPPPSAGGKAIGRRPVLLLSWDAGLGIRDRVTVAPVTTRIRGLDAEVLLDKADGMDEPSAVNCDIVATVLLSTLAERIGVLSDLKMRQVERALHVALGMDLPCGIA
jgi:mRNA interferase MazF